LRFAAEGDSCKYIDCSDSPVLSPSGMELLNDSKEVCYLTHFVIRLFEDTGRKISDARRFRVEILFSSGASATPIHQAQSTKGSDLTRLDTEPLVSVGRDNLTCAEVEDFFSCCINEGGECDDQYGHASLSTAAEMMKTTKSKKETPALINDESKSTTNVASKTTSNTTSASTNTLSVEQQQTDAKEGELESKFSLESTTTMRTTNKSSSKQTSNNAGNKKTVTDLFTPKDNNKNIDENN